MPFILTAGERHHASQALALMTGLPALHVLVARTYDSHAILNSVEASGATPIITRKAGMFRPRACDPAIYKQRNRIKCAIGRPMQLRRIATCYDPIPANYLTGFYLASLSFWP